MKIKNLEKMQRNLQAIPFRRNGKIELTLWIEALPLGFIDSIEEMLPSPQAPQRDYCRDSKRKLLKDKTGRPIPFFDTQDPEYKKASLLISNLQMMAMIHKAIDIAENEIEWEADPQLPKAEYYAAIREEFKAFGFSFGEIIHLMEQINILSKISTKEVEEAAEDFLSPQDPGS